MVSWGVVSSAPGHLLEALIDKVSTFQSIIMYKSCVICGLIMETGVYYSSQYSKLLTLQESGHDALHVGGGMSLPCR